MELFLNKVEEQLTIIDKQLEPYDSLSRISRKMNIRVSLLASLSILLGSILCFIVFGPSLLTNIIGSVYPIYHTLSIMKSHTQEEFIECIVYWTVFGFLYVIDTSFSNISYYLPFFYPFKVSVLLACISKETNLSRVIYDDFIAEFFNLPSTKDAKRMKVVNDIKNSGISDMPSYTKVNNE